LKGTEKSMTVIINTIWGGRISQIVDRQISLLLSNGSHSVVDPESNKVVIILTKDALASIAYTGVAVASSAWLDCQIANCLAHRTLDFALCQPGSNYLARPIHTVIKELALNLNGRLNKDSRARTENLVISIVGWHLCSKLKPFAWELKRGAPEPNGMRYFKLKTHQAGKFARENPTGLWGETLGNPGTIIDERLKELAGTINFTHDEVEEFFRPAIYGRSRETTTVSPDCIAVQLDPRVDSWQARITYYPSEISSERHPLLSPWVLTPRLICAPSRMSSNYLPTSECGRYAIGGFDDGNTNLKVELRIPLRHKQDGGVLSMAYYERKRIS
jgi:hypothetical protein